MTMPFDKTKKVMLANSLGESNTNLTLMAVVYKCLRISGLTQQPSYILYPKNIFSFFKFYR
jgi:hypothetical protein